MDSWDVSTFLLLRVIFLILVYKYPPESKFSIIWYIPSNRISRSLVIFFNFLRNHQTHLSFWKLFGWGKNLYVNSFCFLYYFVPCCTLKMSLHSLLVCGIANLISTVVFIFVPLHTMSFYSLYFADFLFMTSISSFVTMCLGVIGCRCFFCLGSLGFLGL